MNDSSPSSNPSTSHAVRTSPPPATPPTGILLLSCPDRKGLVSSVADFIFRHGGNIIHADQHTDQEERIFLQRVEFELGSLKIEREEIGPAFTPLATEMGMRWAVRFSDETRRTAILVSRYGHCMYDLLARWRLGELPAEVPLVISNHDELESAGREFAVGFHHLPVTSDTRARQEAEILELLIEHQIDLVVLARYMQILSDDFVRHYENRIVNIHHSFLPAFAGGRPYHKAHARGVKIIGATAHYVTAQLDEGPIIEQDVVRVSHRDSVADLVHKGRDLEKVVLARAVHRHLDNRVLVYGNKTVVFD